MTMFDKMQQLKKSKSFKLVLGGSALSIGAAGTALATGLEAPPAEEREDQKDATPLNLEGNTVLVPSDDVLGDDLDSDTATPDSPASPASVETPETPASPASPVSAESVATPESPASPESPVSPASPVSPDSPVSPESPASPASVDTPETPDSPDDEGDDE